LQAAMAGSERIFKLLDTPVKIVDERPAEAGAPLRADGAPASAGLEIAEFESIEFRDVWSAYNDEEWVLRNVSFRVGRGERVQADRFISRLPEGYQSVVRERGAGFSVGEKQLLSFARALAFDPPVLILDEATSSIDTETERLIQEAIQTLLVGRTSIVIAHR